MNFSFENQGTNTYLVYSVGEDDILDTMSLGMLTNNKIPGLAPALFTQMDTTKYIKYNVSAHISAKQFFTGAVNKKRLVGVFRGIVDAMISAEDYMIDTASILLDLDYIFADVSTCETVLICLPVTALDAKQHDLGAFFKNIVFTTQFDQTENCDYVAKIINYLNSTPMFSLYDFKALLESIDTAAVNSVPVQSVNSAPVNAQPVQKVVQPSVQVQQPQVIKNPEPIQQSAAPQPAPAKKEIPPVAPNKPAVAPAQTPVAHPQPQQTTAAPAAAEGESKMSLFYLLQHYNKENAEIYKAQKQAKKSGGNVASAAPASTPAPKAVKPAPAPNAGFAIPGQSTPSPAGFAIPGQSAPAPAPVSKEPAMVGAKTVPAPAPAPSPAPVSAPVYQPAAQPQTQSMNFGETTVLNVGMAGMGETTVLGGGMMNVELKPFLIRIKNNEKISINKPVYRLGKEKSYVDYFIGDNSAISRSHANIISRDGEYFVVDTNSTNHTYVNNNMIQSNVEVKLSSGDRVRLGNEEFDFKMM